jgi:hypothetical protein
MGCAPSAEEIETKLAGLTSGLLSLPSSIALQTATEVLRRGHHLRDTMQHPVVVGQAIELAYLLSAYGVTPTVGRVRPLLNLRTTPYRHYVKRAEEFAESPDSR